MKFCTWLRTFLAFVFHRSQVEREMEAELRAHLESRAEDLERQGLPRAEAERQARIEFGGYERYKEECREALGSRLLGQLVADLCYGLRQLRRSPGFTAVAVLTLALGIGANTAIFTMVNAIVLCPLPYLHSDRLVWISEFDPVMGGAPTVDAAAYVAWKERAKTLERFAARRGSLSFNMTGRGVPARVRGAAVSASFFATLGVEPQLGRAFSDIEAQGDNKVAVLMHPFWQEYFGSDASVLGQTVILDAEPFTIVGVMPASFRFPGDPVAQVLLPANVEGDYKAGFPAALIGISDVLGIIGRLKPGVAVGRAQSELRAIRKRAGSIPWEIELKVVPLTEHLGGNLRPAMLVLLGVVTVVLSIACANVANLLLTRASARTREMAVRTALGASAWRLVRQLLAESVTLALAGGLAGLLLAAWSVTIMVRFIPASAGGNVLSLARPHVDGTVLLFALAVSCLTGVLFGLAPAIATARPDLVEGLKEGGQAANGGRRRGWLRQTLGVAELSLALVLLIGAGLLIKSFYYLLLVDPGFAPERVLTMNIDLTGSHYLTPPQRRVFFEDLLQRIKSLPGVRSAATTDSLPLSPYAVLASVTSKSVPEARLSDSSSFFLVEYAVSPGYFHTLGIPLLRGRTFADSTNDPSSQPVVVNEFLARRIWPGEDPVGKSFTLFFDRKVVVGVVGNTRHDGLDRGFQPEIYEQYSGQHGFVKLAVRTAVEPASLIPAIRAQARAIDPEQPIYNVATLEQALSDSVSPQRLNVLLLGVFAFIALALATVGIYGVTAFSVTQRTHEIGIRMAFGADKGDVLRLVVGQGLRLTAAGVVIGLAGAWALTRFLTSFLFGVRPTDFATYGVVSLALASVSLLASYIPARRATKVDPMVALRHE
jgi:putative ABC transport system permease protein